MKRRVVVTGMGAVTPCGLNVPDFWNSMIEGKSGIDYITYFDTELFPTKFAGELKGFNPLNYLDRKTAQRTDPFCQYALVAAEEAIKDSGINPEKINLDRAGVVTGSGIGGLITFANQAEIIKNRNGNPDRLSPFFIPMMISDIVPGRLSMIYGFRGPNYATVSACSTSANSIIDSTFLIQHDYADVMITGGSEAAITPLGVGGFNAMKALSTRNDDPKGASRPFDKTRDGFVMGEGAAILILEEYQHALNRGAKIYAEIAGFSLTGDAYHITEPAPNGDGVARAIDLCIKDSGLTINDIDVINAHGTSTPLNDKNETAAIKTVFGERAYEIPVHSIKSMTGHLLGAAGAIEAIAAILTIRDGIIPPTINYKEKDEECDLFYVPNVHIKKDVKTVLSTNSGFGGHNTAIIFKKVE